MRQFLTGKIFYLSGLTVSNAIDSIPLVFVTQYVALTPAKGLRMERLIRVELKDGSICRMVKKAFYLFLAQNKVAKFERSDGWVAACQVPVRNMSVADRYNGPERRCA